MPESKPCPHRKLKKQIVGGLHWYACEVCRQKFKAEPWDGKMRVIEPESKPAVSESRERFLQEIFNRHFPNGAVGVWEFGEEVERETRERCAQALLDHEQLLAESLDFSIDIERLANLIRKCEV